MPRLTLAEVARITEGTLEGDPTETVARLAPLDQAEPGELSFVASARYAAYIPATRATAVLVGETVRDAPLPEGLSVVRVADAHAAIARLLPVLHPPSPVEPGIHPAAVLGESVTVGIRVSVGPYAVVEQGTTLSDGCRIGAHARIGRGCSIGSESLIHAGATLYDDVRIGSRCIVHAGARLGADGFGFVFEGGAYRKVPQVGGVVLGDDVEVGANSTIDRGSIGDTIIGSGTKIDNLVHIGHNCRVGRHVIIVAQVGISGSTQVGDGAVLAGQAGIGGHLRIGAGSRIGAQAGVTADVPPGETVSGYPARPHREALRAQAALFRLPALLRRLGEIERVVRDRFGSAAHEVGGERFPQRER